MTNKTIYILSNDIAYFDASYLTEEQRQKAKVVEVEDLPHREGYTTVLKLNYAKGSAQYVYEQLPDTEIEKLKIRLAATEQALLQIMLEGMM